MYRRRKNIGYLRFNFSKSKMKTEKTQFSFQKTLIQDFEMEADLEKALELAGAGRYQVFHVALMVVSLSAALLEMIGCSFVLPAAACDLNIPDNLRGILTSIPNIGVILSAALWGRAADTLGRKPVLVASSFAAGVFGLGAAFTPNLLGFALCKLAGSFFLSCPSSLGFAYAGELVPRPRRDRAVLLCNGLVTLAAALSPILAWAVLSLERSPGGLAPWRVLAAAYAAPLLLAALGTARAHESPKFLLASGDERQALDVLRRVHATNTGLDEDSFPVTRLTKLADDVEAAVDRGSDGEVEGGSFASLLRPPHLQWLALTGFLMFGLFSLLNGLFLFAPDTINKVMSQSSELGGNLCALISQADNQTNRTESIELCEGEVSFGAFQIMVVSGVVLGALAVALGLAAPAKRTILISMFLFVGAACLLAELAENRTVAGIAMASMQVTALGVGPLTAYAVQLFPTSLRGTAVGTVLMFGRVGSVAGSNLAGGFLLTECGATVVGFAAILFLCSALSFLLPRDNASSATS